MWGGEKEEVVVGGDDSRTRREARLRQCTRRPRTRPARLITPTAFNFDDHLALPYAISSHRWGDHPPHVRARP